jgi:hypothetical protein
MLPVPLYEERPSSRKWWRPIVHFATHTVVGSVIFVLVALPAYGLNVLVTALGGNGTKGYVLEVLTVLEYVIVTLDAVLVVLYLVYAAAKAVREFR